MNTNDYTQKGATNLDHIVGMLRKIKHMLPDSNSILADAKNKKSYDEMIEFLLKDEEYRITAMLGLVTTMLVLDDKLFNIFSELLATNQVRARYLRDFNK